MGRGEIYYVPVSHRRLGCCLGLSPPLPRRGLCPVLDLPERHPQDERVVLFSQPAPWFHLGAGAFTLQAGLLSDPNLLDFFQSPSVSLTAATSSCSEPR
jgi:hypothetical protein